MDENEMREKLLDFFLLKKIDKMKRKWDIN